MKRQSPPIFDSEVVTYLKQVSGMLFFLVLLQWLPEIFSFATKLATGQEVIYESHRFDFMRYVAYVLVGASIAIGLAGLIVQRRKNSKS